MEDESLKKISASKTGDYVDLNGQELRLAPYVYLERGVLLFYNPVTKAKTIFEPESLQTKLKWQYNLELGHFGSTKVWRVMKRFFFWNNMARMIYRTLRTCDMCQKAKCKNYSIMGPTQPILTKEVGELVAVDFYGPLPNFSLR